MSENTLSDIKAYEIIDNRGMPTIRVAVCIDNQFWGHADVPSGSSTGSYEAMELRDGDARYRGKGVLKAIQNIHDIILPELARASRQRCRRSTRHRHPDA
jgi:enolase